MYGGVADKYKLYKQIGEPFKEGRSYYVMVQQPFGKSEPIKVRFYTDKTHAATKNDTYAKSLYSIFGFKSKDDFIQIVREIDLSKDELENFFYFNWEKGRKWRSIDLYGGAWYAPADEVAPPIAHPEKIFKCSWGEFKAQNKRRCTIAEASNDCVWFKEI